MHKTKEVRSACGTDIHTPAEPAYQEDKQLKKNDLLLQVVKSNNFQKLLSSRSEIFKCNLLNMHKICVATHFGHEEVSVVED